MGCTTALRFPGRLHVLVWVGPRACPRACNDAAAIGAISAVREMGLRVPEDVSISGFDGTPLGAYTVPSLTTAKVPIREIGAQAVHRLAGRIDGTYSRPPEQKVSGVDLVLRQSTASPAT